MAITVSGPTIIFDDTSVAQASLYDETFGTGVFPEGGTSLTISGGTAFSSATGGKGNVVTTVGVKTDASVILTTPQSGSITVNPIVSGVYIFSLGGGAGGGGATSPTSGIAGSAGTPSFFSTVIGNGGSASTTPPVILPAGGAGGTATGGTTNTSGSAGGNGGLGPAKGGNAAGFPNGVSGEGGAKSVALNGQAIAGSPGDPFGSGGGGGASIAPTGLFAVIGGGGGGGGLAIHPRLTITGGSPYPYQVGAPGAGGPATAGGSGGAGAAAYLKFVLYD